MRVRDREGEEERADTKRWTEVDGRRTDVISSRSVFFRTLMGCYIVNV